MDIQELIPFCEGHQSVHLVKPNYQQLLYAVQNTTHYLLITGKHPFERMITSNGWMNKQYSGLDEDQSLYCNMAYMPTSWTELWGWYNFEEYFTEVAERLSHRARILEIGTFHGRGIAHLATMMKDLRKEPEIYTIDCYQYNYHKFPNSPLPSPTFDRNVKVFRSLGLRDLVTLVPSKSSRCHELFEEQFFDFIFIDGDHLEVSITNDLRYYCSKLKPTGFIAGHDYCDEYPGVIHAVNKRFGEDLRFYDGTVWEWVS